MSIGDRVIRPGRTAGSPGETYRMALIRSLLTGIEAANFEGEMNAAIPDEGVVDRAIRLADLTIAALDSEPTP